MKPSFKLSPHIAVNVDSPSIAAQFYKETLGFNILGEKPEEIHTQKDEINFYFETGEKDHVFFEFEVDDASAAKAVLIEKGCTITKEFALTSFMVQDPFGLRFHVFEKKMK